MIIDLQNKKGVNYGIYLIKTINYEKHEKHLQFI